jgi:hypothetical protein
MRQQKNNKTCGSVNSAGSLNMRVRSSRNKDTEKKDTVVLPSKKVVESSCEMGVWCSLAIPCYTPILSYWNIYIFIYLIWLFWHIYIRIYIYIIFFSLSLYLYLLNSWHMNFGLAAGFPARRWATGLLKDTTLPWRLTRASRAQGSWSWVF